ncbi:hypothetical protein KPL74_02190 [Bacillus sp. NP157]|nr:hypothetical protein KPL74_02190 [Bacillus sp. NP157]
MATETPDLTDVLIRHERRGILGALLVMLVLGAGAVAEWAGVDFHYTRFATMAAAILIPGVILVATGRSLFSRGALAGSRRAVRSDEARRAAMDRASRYALAVTLTAMSLYAIASQAWPFPAPPAALLAIFTVLGVVVFLGAFLWLDRPE